MLFPVIAMLLEKSQPLIMNDHRGRAIRLFRYIKIMIAVIVIIITTFQYFRSTKPVCFIQ